MGAEDGTRLRLLAWTGSTPAPVARLPPILTALTLTPPAASSQAPAAHTSCMNPHELGTESSPLQAGHCSTGRLGAGGDGTTADGGDGL